MPLSAPEYWLEWTKNYFRCQFTHVGELIHKETWSAASFGWAEGLQTINPPIYRLTTAVSDIDQTNINRDIRDGNWLSIRKLFWCNGKTTQWKQDGVGCNIDFLRRVRISSKMGTGGGVYCRCLPAWSVWVPLAGEVSRSQTHFLTGSSLQPSLHSQTGCPLTMA